VIVEAEIGELEKIVLHPAQDGRQYRKSRIFAARNRRDPDERVQFIDGAVSFYPQRVLRLRELRQFSGGLLRNLPIRAIAKPSFLSPH
jgi:hypothetical protein